MLIEFHDFVCQNSARLLDIESDVKTNKETNDRLMEDIAKKMEIIKQLRIKNENICIQEEEMLKQIAEMKDEILETQGCKNDLKRQYDDTKVAISACESAIQVAELKTVEKKKVAEQIAFQIIQPIEREELKERENFLARIRKENSEKKNLAKLKQTLDVCRCASELMENEFMPCLSEIQQIKNNIKELKTGISQHETSRRTLMEKSEDHKMKIQQLQEVFLSKQAKNSQMRVTWNRKIEGLKEENKLLNMSLENIMQSKAEDEIVAQDIVNERK
ncbi:hypothetical protein SK128_009526 [Halocaridina rubra]|uniref:Uncharacterized protein n=1 Tax=Halocaridina rubra TaxID=373956 RepID=A0AAN8X1T8_HALRR